MPFVQQIFLYLGEKVEATPIWWKEETFNNYNGLEYKYASSRKEKKKFFLFIYFNSFIIRSHQKEMVNRTTFSHNHYTVLASTLKITSTLESDYQEKRFQRNNITLLEFFYQKKKSLQNLCDTAIQVIRRQINVLPS